MRHDWFGKIPLLILGTLSVGGNIQAKEATDCKAYLMTGKVKIDGELSDPAWETLPVHTGFVWANKGDTYASYQSSFQVGYDKNAIYVSIRADEPRLKAHLEVARKRETGEVNWKYQLFEVFLSPKTPQGLRHYQFALDILGHKRVFQAQLEGKPYVHKQTKWKQVDIPWQKGVKTGSDFFTMEFRFPFKTLGGHPQAGDRWKLHIGRHGTWAPKGVHWSIANWSAWNPLQHWANLDYHAVMEFAPDSLYPEYARKLTSEINKDFYEWKATHGERLVELNAIVARTEGKPNILRQLNRKLRRNRKPSGLGLAEKPSDSWHRGTWNGPNNMPKAFLLEWDKPVEFNCNVIGWLSTTCHATDYALEHWDGKEWQVAYVETGHDLPRSAHVFPAVKATKARLTITGFNSSSWYMAVNEFGLFLVDDVGAEKP
ncbi:MAG: hypothetical protein QF437_03635 [Planctomycetota bacterium]|nr:hypothetical protein [Planctomycetota bacterium]MDP7129551.1 hypothetical protein [Planctomycetota bacterium]